MVTLKKSYKDMDFLNSPDARQIRILCELIAPKVSFEKNKIENTIVFFGSARSVASDIAQKDLKAVEASIINNQPTPEQIQKLSKARTHVKLSKYYDEAVTLAKKITEWSLNLKDPKDRFYICSGGGPGMMEAANRGANEAGGDSIGFNISLPFEQEPNQYQTEALSHEFHYFFIRKFWFAYLAKALVVFPGGFGTMDEMFELMTLIQTQKIEKHMPIVLFGKAFWNAFLNFEALVEWGVISEKDLKLFRIIDDVDEAFHYLKDSLTQFYL